MFQVSQQGTIDVIYGNDPLTEPNLSELNHVFEETLKHVPPRIVLNMADIPLMDSAGLEWTLDATERCALMGGRLQIAAANPLCRDILRITGVGEQFETFVDVRSAARSFAR
ncbi:MAG: STAS domain-containing protein [Planctomycetes bacterium]|nr:STAS domain-containing protein [Planctomycetota bacterium]